MAYSKTTWQNNVTDIDENNLNKMEQGIYDNSLVVDAVTNKLNPTDTETYKTAELTEGQITDVIGVNDILIKGQTSQNGEPTSSSPVDVNVVSGSNTVNTSNKNHFVDKTITFSYIDPNTGYETYNGDWRATSYESNILPNTTYNFSWESNNGYFQCLFHFYDKQRKHIESIDLTSPNTYSKSFTTPSTFKYYRISYAINVGGINVTRDKIQLEIGNSRTTYEPHQGKELPLDLGTIELCKIGDYQDYFDRDNNAKWYLHKVIGKVVLNGQQNSFADRFATVTGNYRFVALVSGIKPQSNSEIADIISDKAIPISANDTYNNTQGIAVNHENSLIIFYDEQLKSMTVSEANTWLTTNNIILYYVLLTPTITEITNTTLISQLEAIYNAPLYEQTNITQINNDLSMVLDITACKDNINGIKAFIRK